MAPVVAKWGHSLAVRLPMHIAKQTGIRAGDRVEITAGEDGSVTISPARPKYSLDELVDKITSRNVHGEIYWGGPRGGEVW
jgi:antitoxin MazE